MPYKDKEYGNTKRREKEIEFPFVPIIRVIKKRIKNSKKVIPFNLSVKWAKENYSGKCELTGIPFKRANNRVSNPYSPSVDRIKPELGYVEENCRKILMGLNGLKHTGCDEDMYTIAEALIANRKKVKND
jgi:hypothetical protein